MVVLQRLVVVRVVEVPEQKLALLDVHEGGGEVDIHLLGGLHGGAVLGEQQVVHGDDEIALLAGQIGVLLIGGDGRAVAVVRGAVGQGDVELRDGAVGGTAVDGRGGMVGHVPAEQPRIVGFHVVEVLGDEAGVDAGDVEGGFRAVEEGGEGDAHVNVEGDHRDKRDADDDADDDAGDFQRPMAFRGHGDLLKRWRFGERRWLDFSIPVLALRALARGRYVMSLFQFASLGRWLP